MRKALAGWGRVEEGCVCFESLVLLESGEEEGKRRERREKRRRE